MRDDVVARIRRQLPEHDLDAIVCVSPENVAYTAGFVVPSQPLMRWRQAMTLIHVDGRTGIICVDMEETTVREKAGTAEVRTWQEFVDQPMSVFADMLRDWGLGSSRVGIEMNYLPVAEHRKLVEQLPGLELVAGDQMLTRSRQIKTPSELALLERLSKISDTAISRSLESVSAGCTEMDIAASLTQNIYAQGAQQFKLMIVATGERSQLPNVGPSDRALEAGDICRVEIFSVIDGYQGGVCRTAVVGDPSPVAQRIYDNLSECKQEVLNEIRPGASTRKIYEKYRETFNALDMPAISFVAHSIGVNLHEPPYVGPHSDHVIEEGMVLGMEPLVYRTGHGFGMQIKDMVAVESDGARLLSDVTDTRSLPSIAS